MTDGLISDSMRADIESGVAAALNEADLRAALAAHGVDGIPEDQNEVDLIVMLVPRTHGRGWPAHWHGSDTFWPYLAGSIVAAVEAQDIAAGREARPLKDYQLDWLATWRDQVGHESS